MSVMFRMNGMPRAQEAQERRVSISHAVSLQERRVSISHVEERPVSGLHSVSIFCMGAEVARYLSPGLATSTSL